MRKIEARGRSVFLNNKPIYLRGYGDDGMYPQTLCPETDPEKLRARLRLAREYGFNLAYPCLIMQPEEYLDAADEVGMLVKFDAGAPLGFQRNWPGVYRAQWPAHERRQASVDQWMAILRWTQNHPSVVIYSTGSELNRAEPILAELYGMARRKDATRLVSSWSGMERATDIVSIGPPGCEPSEELPQSIESWLRTGSPWISEPWWERRDDIPALLHEYAGVESFLDPETRPLYTLQSYPAQAHVDAVTEALGISEPVSRLVSESRKWANRCREFMLEEARKAPGIAGYQMWLIQDIPGYPQGIFDPFWQPKDIAPEEFLMANGESVILINEKSRRTRKSFRPGEQAEFEVFVAHGADTPIKDAALDWRLCSPEGKPLSAGKLGGIQVGGFGVTNLAGLLITMPEALEAMPVRLVMTLSDGKTELRNEWRLWIMPRPSVERPEKPVCLMLGRNEGAWERMASEFGFLEKGFRRDAALVISDQMDEPLAEYMAEGGTVFLLCSGGGAPAASVRTHFRPGWPWSEMGVGINLGLIREHPAMAGFPHDGICDFHFLHLIAAGPGLEGRAFNLDLFSERIEPVIRVFTAKANAAYLFEAKAGNGRLLATTLRFEDTVGVFPEAAFLFGRLLCYALGCGFAPASQIHGEDLRLLMGGGSDSHGRQGGTVSARLPIPVSASAVAGALKTLETERDAGKRLAAVGRLAAAGGGESVLRALAGASFFAHVEERQAARRALRRLGAGEREQAMLLAMAGNESEAAAPRAGALMALAARGGALAEKAFELAEQMLLDARMLGDAGALPCFEEAYVEAASALGASNPEKAGAALKFFIETSKNEDMVKRAAQALQ